MATYVKYQVMVGNLAGKVMDLLGTTPGSDCDTLKVMLSNTAPNVSTHTVRADVTEIAGGGGYTSGGTAVPNQSGTRTGGTFTLVGDEIVWTATSGGIAQFRYAILYDDTPTSPADPLISHWDYGSAIDLAEGETFTWKPSNLASAGTILTLA